MALSINKGNFHANIDGVIHNVTNQVDGMNVELQKLLDNDNYLADKKIDKAGIVDALDSVDSSKVLSARMGNMLNDSKVNRAGDKMLGNLGMGIGTVIVGEREGGPSVNLIGLGGNNQLLVGNSTTTTTLISPSNPFVRIGESMYEIYSSYNLTPANYIKRAGDLMDGALSFHDSEVKIFGETIGASKDLVLEAPNSVKMKLARLGNNVEVVKAGVTFNVWDSENFNPADKLEVDGNAVSATKLRTARSINGVAFDGTKSIEITANPNQHTHTDAEIPCPYGVGDIYITTKTAHPSERWVGTGWKKIEGRFLLGTEGNQTSKLTGGNSSVIIPVSCVPSHTHTFSATTSTAPKHRHLINIRVNSAGAHTHLAGNHRHQVDNHIHSQGDHNHVQGKTERGIGVQFGTSGTANLDTFEHHKWYSNIGRALTSSTNAGNTGGSAPFTNYVNPSTESAGTHDHSASAECLDAGDHNHTVSGTTGATGGRDALNITPKYYTVHIWERQV